MRVTAKMVSRVSRLYLARKMDRQKQREAVEIYQALFSEISRMVNHYDSSRDYLKHSGDYWYLEARYFFPKESGLVFLFNAKGTGMAYFSNKAKPFKSVVHIPLISKLTTISPEIALPAILEATKKYKRTLIHELTHYLDWKRMGDAAWAKVMESYSRPEKEDEGTEDYYNDPLELNAYFQEAAENFNSKMESGLEELKVDYRNMSEDDEWEYSDKVYRWLDNGGEDWWHSFLYEYLRMDFYNKLTPENKRRVQKRFLQNAMRLRRKAVKIVAPYFEYRIKIVTEKARAGDEDAIEWELPSLKNSWRKIKKLLG